MSMDDEYRRDMSTKIGLELCRFAERIETLEDFVTFLDRFAEQQEKWHENTHPIAFEMFLKGMSAWMKSWAKQPGSDFYKLLNDPSWRTFAIAMLGGEAYD
jgi:hypothetical protein